MPSPMQTLFVPFCSCCAAAQSLLCAADMLSSSLLVFCALCFVLKTCPSWLAWNGWIPLWSWIFSQMAFLEWTPPTSIYRIFLPLWDWTPTLQFHPWHLPCWMSLWHLSPLELALVPQPPCSFFFSPCCLSTPSKNGNAKRERDLYCLCCWIPTAWPYCSYFLTDL